MNPLAALSRYHILDRMPLCLIFSAFLASFSFTLRAEEVQEFFTAAVIFNKTNNACSEAELVLNTTVTSTSSRSSLERQLRATVKEKYPNSSYGTYLVAVIPKTEAIVIYRFDKKDVGWGCVDHSIAFERGKTLEEARAKLDRLPKSRIFKGEIAHWPKQLLEE
ncbi:MAG: hypothetical protein CL583_04800 [Alteromonadaceae bacterium]|nr:hypothetical protein [Alteromonadaceae bacterium]